MKKLLIFTVILFSLTIFSFSASAENQVTDIDAEIVINDNGSADFYQTWQCNFDENTEVYYFFPDEGKYEISDFVVRDEDKTYETVSYWDISLGFDEKAGKCGILKYEDGYELCWGITEYGEKTYNISFKINNLVAAYKDADATYFCLFSKNVNTRPTDISVKISFANGKELVDASTFEDGEFSDDGNCTFLSLGYYGDDIIKNGAYITQTTSALSYSEQMAFNFIFEKNLITPTYTEKENADETTSDFIDAYYFNNNSSNESANWYDSEIFIIVFIMMFLGIPLSLFLLWKIFYYSHIKRTTKKPEINRQEPSLGIEASHIMLTDFKLGSDGNLLTLIFLDMIESGAITPILPDADDPISVSKGNVRFKINPADSAEELDKSETKFHKFLTIAASDDQILDPREIKVKSQDYFDVLRNIINVYIEDGEKKIDAAQLKRKSKFLSAPFLYTTEGKAELRKVLGYKKYLMEYSVHNPANVLDHDLWKAPMRYAVIFGETDKIKEQLRKAYPTSNYALNEFSQNLIFAQQAAKLMEKGIHYSEKNYGTTRYAPRYGSYTRTSFRTGGYHSSGGFGGGSFGGRSGGGTR